MFHLASPPTWMLKLNRVSRVLAAAADFTDDLNNHSIEWFPPSEKPRKRTRLIWNFYSTYCILTSTDSRRKCFLVAGNETFYRAKAPAKRWQRANATYRNIVGRNMLRALGHRVATCCDMFDVVGSNLTIFKLEPTTPNMSQHIATRWPNVHNILSPNNVAICCVGMLPSFGRGFMQTRKATTSWRLQLKW